MVTDGLPTSCSSYRRLGKPASPLMWRVRESYGKLADFGRQNISNRCLGVW